MVTVRGYLKHFSRCICAKRHYHAPLFVEFMPFRSFKNFRWCSALDRKSKELYLCPDHDPP